MTTETTVGGEEASASCSTIWALIAPISLAG
jgi:hypothetical protein